ncbi:hypothetical protein ACQEU6_07320 [Spirillospora sp. CA-108201]
MPHHARRQLVVTPGGYGPPVRAWCRAADADANALLVTEPALEDFIACFDEPDGEGEEVVDARPQ